MKKIAFNCKENNSLCWKGGQFEGNYFPLISLRLFALCYWVYISQFLFCFSPGCCINSINPLSCCFYKLYNWGFYKCTHTMQMNTKNNSKKHYECYLNVHETQASKHSYFIYSSLVLILILILFISQFKIIFNGLTSITWCGCIL